MFEDGKTISGLGEAIEWAMCNRFSPLNNGFRVNPFWTEYWLLIKIIY